MRGRWKNPSISSRSMFDDIYVKLSISTLFAVNIWIRTKYPKLNFKVIIWCWETNILKNKRERKNTSLLKNWQFWRLMELQRSKVLVDWSRPPQMAAKVKPEQNILTSSSSQSSFSSSPIINVVTMSTTLTTTSAYKSKNWSLQRSYLSSSQQWRWWSSVYVYVQHPNHQPRYCAHHNTTTGTSTVQQMTKPLYQTSPRHPSFFLSPIRIQMVT